MVTSIKGTYSFQKWKGQINPSRLIHGPMVGQVTEESASFWFRTDGQCEIGVEVTGHSGRESVTTRKEEGYVGVVQIDGLLPGTYFAYEIFVNGEKFVDPDREFGFRTFPQSEEGAKFTVAFGGCSGFVPEYEPVWEVIAGHDPRATLFLGDNVYIDDPDDVMWTGDYCYVRRHSRPEWKKLTAKTSIHAIYDDHDFGMDDCIPGALIDLPPWKKPVLENFKKIGIIQ